MATRGQLPNPGDIILSRYMIEEPIGRGGFGVVYRATQLGLQRVTAIKMLLPSAMVHEEMVERFRREAILARNLNHPNTIRLYDFGQTETGILFIAMEYLKGRSLDEIIKSDGPLTLDRVQRIGVQILKSLAEAHQHNVIHRDIKPSNIFICDGIVGEPDFVKVLDFGIAKAFGEEESRRLTQTGQGFGTAFYMAPEQIRSEGVGPHTDLYALGLMLTEALTGAKVYTGNSSMEIAVKQLSEEPPPIPDWVLRGPMGPVLQRATQKDARLRYPSAVEMLRDLRALDPNASIDISAKFQTQPQKAVKAGSSGGGLPLLLVGVGLLTLLLVGGAVAGLVAFGVLGGAPRKSPEPPPKVVEVDKPPTPPRETTPDSPPEPETPRIKIIVRSRPTGASVFHGEKYLGATPVELPFDPAEAGVTLRVSKEEFKEHLLEVGLKDNGEYEVELERLDLDEVALGTGGEVREPVKNDQTPPKSDDGKEPQGPRSTDVPAPNKPAGNTPPGPGKKPGGKTTPVKPPPKPEDIKIPRL